MDTIQKNNEKMTMNSRKIKLFTIGYSDNASTSYILDYLISHGVVIDGVIFCKSQLRRSWKRLIKKIKMRGFAPALKRIYENLLVRRKEISQIYHRHIDKVFFVDKINSEEVRDILISNEVELLILTSTPIIRSIILDIDGLTIINAHTGWLPKYRGLDANLKALRDGYRPSVSVHKVTKEIDGGKLYIRDNFNIDYNGDILKQMDEKELQLSGKLLVEVVNLMSRNVLKPIAQSEPLGKYEPPLSKNERNKIIQDLKRKL